MDIPRRKIEKPGTLEDAYKLIESMQSVATKSMFRFLREADTEGVIEQYKNGADIFAREPETKLVPLQIVACEIAKLAVDGKVAEEPITEQFFYEPYDHDNPPDETKEKLQQKLHRLLFLKRWLKANCADCSLFFYMLAKSGDVAALKKSMEYHPINAIDENGKTAVDWAIDASDWETAKLLHSCGGTCNYDYKHNEALKFDLEYFCDQRFMMDEQFPDNNRCEGVLFRIVKAIECGFPPETEVEITRSEIMEPKLKHTIWPKSTFWKRILSEGRYDMIEACLRCGFDVNFEILYKEEGDLPWDDFKKITAIEIVNKWQPSEAKERLLKLLRSYGAKENICDERE